ncbi:uncharacterized protein Tco025E_00030 [Trypanosoma conorhini]|uniref:Uncharacterized protein n=1 Tax=Trypanosoma conorhini TaxID=83891 RepID=A0A3R7LML5_9TRYP|nr:uncharacterized protein Tco025E_00030 [Trypanosoma conorhini]RNF27646.1 hypothetical protein Tco025E_00030 [Trypanosoma conorhini]
MVAAWLPGNEVLVELYFTLVFFLAARCSFCPVPFHLSTSLLWAAGNVLEVVFARGKKEKETKSASLLFFLIYFFLSFSLCVCVCAASCFSRLCFQIGVSRPRGCAPALMEKGPSAATRK